MLRIELSGQDLALIRFAPQPAPLVELKLSLMMLRRQDSEQTFGRWRRELRQRLPVTTRPLWDLLTPYRGPAFLDPVSPDLPSGLDAVRTMPTSQVRACLEEMWAQREGQEPVPRWLRDLAQGDPATREQLCQSLQDAYQAVLGASWPRVTALHSAEYARYALNTAEHGVVGALTRLCAGSRLVDGVWEIDAPYRRQVASAGRGLLLLPTFHWTCAPLVADKAQDPLLMVYPAGPGMPLMPAAAGEDVLAPVLGNTRAHTLRLLGYPLSTSELAGHLGISLGAASTHAATLRAAGLIDTVRAGRAVRHERTALGTLLTGGVDLDRC
ncbi:winged helix-turn-helix domain-containing protein [Streptomyces camelliae]|uniref:Winged helix-turn-helix domain-containing protein n=1 Tax=Streptomyces camelliae TaxID=3004093 RepID=A0ABY7P4G9_9ACTN|nr:winged helix-turn-helix domain-containing protein [Streptomyces sp. HUAS 2-6]WBO65420.1 winged helix-turn-helix domain-containing protein [Streptomyces sp. HUAS 2-6]